MQLATPPQSPQPKNARLSDVVRKARKRPASAKKTFQSPLEKRSLESHSDVKPWVREAAVAEYRAALGPGGRLKPGGVALLLASFEKQNLSIESVRRWNREQRKAELEGAGPMEARRSLRPPQTHSYFCWVLPDAFGRLSGRSSRSSRTKY